MIYIGIDPGKEGGLAWIGQQNVEAIKMPETERDVWEFFRQWEGCEAFALIEKVGAMPKQGVSSTFKFGRGYGFLRGCLIASGIPWDEVTPQKWQGYLSCRTGGDKNVTKAKAQQLFPGIKKITHATADSLLIAEYCRRTKAALSQSA